jgi:MFS family permease
MSYLDLTPLRSFEASITPAFVLIVSMWYRREEQGGRMSMWLAANGVTTIIVSPVAYGLSGLVNPAIASWRVLYILVSACSLTHLLQTYELTFGHSLASLHSSLASCTGSSFQIRN